MRHPCTITEGAVGVVIQKEAQFCNNRLLLAEQALAAGRTPVTGPG